jgi:hypothetical protein
LLRLLLHLLWDLALLVKHVVILIVNILVHSMMASMSTMWTTDIVVEVPSAHLVTVRALVVARRVWSVSCVSIIVVVIDVVRIVMIIRILMLIVHVPGIRVVSTSHMLRMSW